MKLFLIVVLTLSQPFPNFPKIYHGFLFDKVPEIEKKVTKDKTLG
jgi:hypothetical protein